VVPIRLSGLYEIYSIHDSWPRRGPVHVSIGGAIEFPADLAYEEATRRLEERLKQM
jgi:1-acyl-sn-glycerol-3-phosphate acyltransferase